MCESVFTFTVIHLIYIQTICKEVTKMDVDDYSNQPGAVQSTRMKKIIIKLTRNLCKMIVDCKVEYSCLS
jgi:hypothetical protein